MTKRNSPAPTTKFPFSWDVAAAPAGVYEFMAKAKYPDDTEVTSLTVQMEIRSTANGVPMDRSDMSIAGKKKRMLVIH